MEKIKRLVATFIDYFIIILALSMPLSIICYLFDLLIVYVIVAILFLTLFLVLFLHKDCLFGYESIGKKIMKLKIYKDNKIVTNKNILIGRVSKTFFLFPLYLIDVLTENKSEGDKIFDTEIK